MPKDTKKKKSPIFSPFSRSEDQKVIKSLALVYIETKYAIGKQAALMMANIII